MIARLLQRIFGALVAFALGLAAALVRGFVSAPKRAVEKAMSDVRVRAARPGEVVDLRHRLLRAGQPRETAIWEGDDEATSHHAVAERDGVIVGVGSVIRRPWPLGDGPAFQLRGMAVVPELRSHGVGAQILAHLERTVGEPMWCNARVPAVRFYEKHGWETVGEVWENGSLGPHLRMRHVRR